jgi:hypothetical protein
MTYKTASTDMSYATSAEMSYATSAYEAGMTV